MQTTLTREQYDECVGRTLAEFLAAYREGTTGEIPTVRQYPKSSAEALREMHYRGVVPGDGLVDREWLVWELDRTVLALEQCGQLTDEAKAAAAAGVSLFEYRKAVGNVVSS